MESKVGLLQEGRAFRLALQIARGECLDEFDLEGDSKIVVEAIVNQQPPASWCLSFGYKSKHILS